MGTHYIVGVDEVGRGALAGPVVVAAVSIPKRLRFSNRKLGKLRDSKKLTPKRREAWSEYLKSNPGVNYALARVYPRQIEKRNISGAANLAAFRAFSRLADVCRLKVGNCKICLDGGLYLGNKRRFTQNVRRSTQKIIPRMSAFSPRWSATTVVRGDEKIKAIAAASIIAKVSRDRGMVRLAKKYPQYRFEIHKGYGTKKHFAAIKKHGPSKVHRLTFLRFS
jgi:ribonuclease HII